MLRTFKKILPVLVLLAVLVPSLVLAQPTYTENVEVFGSAGDGVCTYGGLSYILCTVHELLNSIVPVLLALGVVYFVFGVVQYVIGGGEEAKTQGRDRMIWGIVGFAIILGMWGLVSLIVNTFGIEAQLVNVPSVVSTSTQAVGDDCVFPQNAKLQDVLRFGTCFIQNAVIPFMFALSIAFFIWGIIQFLILGASDETKRTQGRQHMIWGVVAFAVMLGIWTLVGIVGGTFGLNTSVLPQVKP